MGSADGSTSGCGTADRLRTIDSLPSGVDLIVMTSAAEPEGIHGGLQQSGGIYVLHRRCGGPHSSASSWRADIDAPEAACGELETCTAATCMDTASG